VVGSQVGVVIPGGIGRGGIEGGKGIGQRGGLTWFLIKRGMGFLGLGHGLEGLDWTRDLVLGCF
jgi:hypothetical protein